MIDQSELAVMGALAAARGMLDADELHGALHAAGISDGEATPALARLHADGRVALDGTRLSLTPAGVRAFLELHAAIEAALDPSPRSPVQEDCPSVPWLTTVQTKWIDAVSINYAVEPSALARLLPAPLEPEVWKGSGWVQVLLSSLRDMRPQGLGALFGVCFYQASYRAAVRYPSVDGTWRRGGYFVRSETNHPVMRAVGNALAEFRFHDFGLADMVMVRDEEQLTLGVSPGAEFPGGRVVAVLDTRPLDGPPPGSAWRSVDELHEPLVECYDALGVDRERGHLYILTIDRDPWNPRFVAPIHLYCEYFDSGALGGGVARYDSTLHFRECGYRWRPLRREPLAD
jgi:uncharacterized protein YqjF (DUF2071 family)